MKEMDVQELLDLYKLFEEHEISIVIDGGWGIDALIGEQTRKHDDLDIAIEHKDVPKVRELLAERGYRDIPREDTQEFNFVLGDDKGHEVDVHSYTFDEKGNNIYGIAYPFNSLRGEGKINGVSLRCIALEYVIQFHENYQPDEGDIKDIKALIKKFNINSPKNYKGLI